MVPYPWHEIMKALSTKLAAPFGVTSGSPFPLWIPLTKGYLFRAFMFPLLLDWTICWTNMRFAGGCHCNECPCFMLSGIAAVLTAAFSMYVFQYGWGWSTSMMFGSIISATDPVAVVALLKDLGKTISRVLFQCKDRISRYGHFHYKDDTVVRPSLLNGNPYTGKTAFLSKHFPEVHSNIESGFCI